MTTDDNLTARLAEALRLVDEAVTDAIKKVEGLPDNPRINRISERSFSIRFSDLGKSLSVFDHDWLAQYRYVQELLQKRKFWALKELLSNGSYRDGSHGLRCFAPEVIENLKRITGDLLAAEKLTDARNLPTP